MNEPTPLQSILDEYDAENVHGLYWTIYEHTDCGPWLSVQLTDGTWKHCDDLEGVANDAVQALRVGSIVEGSDAEVTGDVIDLAQYTGENAGSAAADFAAQVERVNAEACSLWDEANTEDDEDEE
jgi:hypothetical protein